MAKRPKFDLPSTKPGATGAKSEWVYRSEDPPAPVEPPTPAIELVAEPAAAAVDAAAMIRSYASYAAGAGLIPVPMVDMLAIGSVQLKMLAALAERYQVPFNHDLGKSVIAALVGSTVSSRLGSGLARSLMKAIPGIGTLGGALVTPVMAYGVTYGLGRVFMMHFEAGGTLLTIDAAAMRDRVQGEAANATA